ncbi:hypothetical protein DM860_011724 [Cuscuta australis]|uniref:DUF4216 domain-containing protein n=1 Tax=Cuscuta australis TaxID=267555 RepID=A0A328DFC6_9ASTE|nr:hypothetical protein DM860_011724 [Cuscuta australis]
MKSLFSKTTFRYANLLSDFVYSTTVELKTIFHNSLIITSTHSKNETLSGSATRRPQPRLSPLDPLTVSDSRCPQPRRLLSLAGPLHRQRLLQRSLHPCRLSSMPLARREYGDYYGVLEEILDVEYPTLPLKRCVLFRCRWYDPLLNRGMKVHEKYGLVEVLKKGEFNRYEPFIFGSQANQVAYVEYPCTQKSKSKWVVVCEVQRRGWVNIKNVVEPTENGHHKPFQANEIERTGIVEDEQSNDDAIVLSIDGDAEFADDELNSEEEEPILISNDSEEEIEDTPNNDSFE